MASILALGIGRWRLLFVGALGVLYLSVFISVSDNFLALQKNGNRKYPFGIFVTPGGGLFAQDFSYNMLFLRGIHERRVARPYQMEGQVQMARLIIPGSQSGLHHAYSPVSFVLTLPLSFVSDFQAYLVDFILTAGAILLLVYFYLLPNASEPLQIGALTVMLPSVCTLTALAIGQSAMLTTVLLGAFWFLLRRRKQLIGSLVSLDLGLAMLFWTICFKPSIAVVPFVLLVGSQAWRALAFGFGLLLATWTLVCGYYGGWWTGLQDYVYLVNHYNDGLIPPFTQLTSQMPVENPAGDRLFAFNRDVLIASSAGLVLLHWTQRITISEMFQILLWVFVLFSPYLLPSEDWILCLLIVEGSFFKSGNVVTACVKLALMAVIFNVRANVGLTDRLAFPAQCILLTWLLLEILRSKYAGREVCPKPPTSPRSSPNEARAKRKFCSFGPYRLKNADEDRCRLFGRSRHLHHFDVVKGQI
jgi:hypothetical protein